MLGAAIGLTLAIRPGGTLFMAALYARFRPLPSGNGVFSYQEAFINSEGCQIAIAWHLMIAFWPWAYALSILNPIHAMIEATRFDMTADSLFMSPGLALFAAMGVASILIRIPLRIYVHTLGRKGAIILGIRGWGSVQSLQ